MGFFIGFEAFWKGMLNLLLSHFYLEHIVNNLDSFYVNTFPEIF